MLFDFDGTITKKDSLKEFLFFYHGRSKVILGLIFLSPVLVLYALKILPNHLAKQILLRFFFRNELASFFNAKCNDFVAQCIPKILQAEAIKRITQHLDNHETIVVVSASLENWIKPWSDQMGLLCIATKLEVIENRITGRYSGNNCYGREKVRRIKERFNLSQFEKIIAYGDSQGDKEMFEIADSQNYRLFSSHQENKRIT